MSQGNHRNDLWKVNKRILFKDLLPRIKYDDSIILLDTQSECLVASVEFTWTLWHNFAQPPKYGHSHYSSIVGFRFHSNRKPLHNKSQNFSLSHSNIYTSSISN